MSEPLSQGLISQRGKGYEDVDISEDNEVFLTQLNITN